MTLSPSSLWHAIATGGPDTLHLTGSKHPHRPVAGPGPQRRLAGGTSRGSAVGSILTSVTSHCPACTGCVLLA